MTDFVFLLFVIFGEIDAEHTAGGRTAVDRKDAPTASGYMGSRRFGTGHRRSGSITHVLRRFLSLR